MRNTSQQRGQQLVLCEEIPLGTREAMRKRMVGLSTALGREHADMARHVAAIAEMLDCWPSLAKADGLKLAQKFAKETSDLPSWAVEKSCMAIRLGQAPNVSFDFPPSTIRLREEVQRHTAPLLQEVIEIRNLLEAEVEYQPTEEERERIKFGFKSLTDALHDREQERRVRAEEARAAAGRGRSQAPTDDELRAHYGTRPKPQQEAAE